MPSMAVMPASSCCRAVVCAIAPSPSVSIARRIGSGTIIHRFNADGIDGISWYPYWQVRNTPRKFTADLREQIGEVALSSPKALIGMTQWSLPKLRAYLIEQRIVPNISIEWLRQFLHRCKIRLQRPK